MPNDDLLYITTPLYYLNARPHIGHAYCTILVDAMARYQRLFGGQSYFLTGTDEHGQKVQQAADAKGVSPQAHVDALQAEFRDLWPTLDIVHDDFIRTTEPRHTEVVRGFLQQLYDNGDIYVDEYEGWYSTAAERFFSEDELVDGKCPDTGQAVQLIKERNYFFRMSKYSAALREHIQTHPNFIRPAHRANEVLGFLDKGLNDLCISRPKERLSWGIPIPFDEDYVTYVWFDALSNYVSALGGPEGELFQRWWPHTQHYIGKDILTTHSVYWTTMLLALGIPLPKSIVATGWWLSDQQKMSKSVGNVVDPLSMKDVYGPDVLRYFLLRDMVVGLDSNFSEEALVRRNNSDLANDLGNLLSRVKKLCSVHFDDKVPEPGPETDLERALITQSDALVAALPGYVADLAIHTAIEETLQLVRALNRYIQVTAPWKTVKTDKPAAARTLYTLLQGVRVAAWCLSPVIPSKSAEILTSIGADPVTTLDKLAWGGLTAGTQLAIGGSLFPKRDLPASEPDEAPAPKVAKKKSKALPEGTIGFDDFLKVQLKVAQILEAEAVEGSDKLLRLQVSLGDETRQIVAGIGKSFAPADLVGKQVVVVANLAPRKVFKVMSEGMVLAVDTPEGGLALLSPTGLVTAGTNVS